MCDRRPNYVFILTDQPGTCSFLNWVHQLTWVEDLAAARYRGAHIGKMLFQPRDLPGGFHDRAHGWGGE